MPADEFTATPSEEVSTTLSDALREASQHLTAAGVASPRVDATLLAAHVLGISRGEVERRSLLGQSWTARQAHTFAELVAQRGDRIPLQHLTGSAAFRRLTLSVGPGVFVPRPETEGLVDLALAHAAQGALVVDLCTGSGAIAAALATERPDLTLHAIELDPMAHAWAQRNLEALAPAAVLHLADATDPATLAELDGQVDVVASNPPYIPTDAIPVDVEVSEHDPGLALYGGSEDGLRVPMEIAVRASTLLHPGGWLVMEHADVQGDALVRRLRSAGWINVIDHVDLTGRPRTAVAQRA